MITIKVELHYLPKTGKLLFDADVLGEDGVRRIEMTALEILMPHLKEGFQAIAKAAGDQHAVSIQGDGERGALIAQGFHDARIKTEREA